MNAKNSDLARIQEIYDIACQTKRQLAEISFSKDSFLTPASATDDLVSEGIMNRVLRIAEEGGRLSEDTEKYGFDLPGIRGVRNRLAHAYGEVDREIIWAVLESDFPSIIEACERYCEDNGLELTETI